MSKISLYSNRDNNRGKLAARNAVLMLILLSIAAISLFPLVYMLLNSFGPSVQRAGNVRSIFPAVWTLDSYKAFLGFSKYSLRWLLNSLIVAGSVTVGNVIFASAGGYAFSKLRFRGKNVLFYLILVGMMIPYQVTQVPLYILIVRNFKLSNTYAALILPSLVSSYNIFLTKQFFQQIPNEVLESAKIDGCSQLGIFLRIVVPLSKTVLAVVAVTTFLGNWNTFFWPFLITSEESMYTIQVGLKQFRYANTTLFGPMMAGAAISTVPMFILFFSLQKYFLEGVTVGAVKG